MEPKKKCQHIELGGIGIIVQEMKGNEKMPDQYGILWQEKANHKVWVGDNEVVYPNHYFWNDKDKIKLL